MLLESYRLIFNFNNVGIYLALSSFQRDQGMAIGACSSQNGNTTDEYADCSDS